MIFAKLEVGVLAVNCYIVGCDKTKEAVVIDAGDEPERILAKLRELDLKLKYIIATHGHFDHIGANRALIEATGAVICGSLKDDYLYENAAMFAEMFGVEAEDSPLPAIDLKDGSVLSAGELKFKTIATPGHSDGGISVFVEDILFTGDTLFRESVGRTDMYGGSFDALSDSIKNKLFVLAGDTRVFPGHGPETTISHEQRHNPYIK